MPWEHCGESIYDDDHACPACGITKREWTMQWDVTRNFRLHRKEGKERLRILLLDEEEEPVPDEPFVLLLPDGDELEDELNELGYAKVLEQLEFPVELTFPEREPGSVSCLEPPEGVSLLEDEGCAGFILETPAKHRFQLGAAVSAWCISVQLLDDDLEPLTGAATVRLPDGATAEHALEAEGRLRVQPVPEGVCAVSLPGREETRFPAVRDPELWIPMRVPVLPDPVGAPDDPYRSRVAGLTPEPDPELLTSELPPPPPTPRAHRIAVQLLDDDLDPLAGTVSLRLPDGSLVERELEAEGRLVVEPVDPGVGAVLVSGREETLFPTVDDPELCIPMRVPRLEDALGLPEDPYRSQAGSRPPEPEPPAPASDAPPGAPPVHRVAVQLLDDDLEPLAGTVSLRLPDGNLVVHELEAEGHLTVEPVEPGVCTVQVPEREETRFPTVDDSELRIPMRVPRLEEALGLPEDPYQSRAGSRSPEPEPEPPPASDAPPPVPVLHRVSVQLLDDALEPLTGTVSLRLPDGSVAEHELEAEGRLTVEPVDPGVCTVQLPEREDTRFPTVDDPELCIPMRVPTRTEEPIGVPPEPAALA